MADDHTDRPAASGWTRRRVVITCVSLAAVLLALYVFTLLDHVFIPLIFGFLIAYVLEPVLKWLNRHKSRRGLTVSMLYVLLAGLLLSGILMLGPKLIAQTQGFIGMLQKGGGKYDIPWESLMDGGAEAEEETDADGERPGREETPGPADDGEEPTTDEGTTDADTTVSSFERFLAPTREEPTAKAAPAEPDGEADAEEGTFMGFIRSHLQSFARMAPAAMARVVQTLFTGARSAVEWLIQITLVFFYAFFFMLRFTDIRRTCMGWIPKAHEEETKQILAEIDDAVASFFRGRMLVCVVSAVVTSVGLLLSGIEYWLLLGFAAGFLGIIPIVGVTIALIPAVVIGLASPHPLFQTVGVAITFSVVQGAVEPLVGSFIIGKEVHFHPVTIIVAFLIGGALFGLIGLLFAVPVLAIARILARHFLMPRLRDAVDPIDA